MATFVWIPTYGSALSVEPNVSVISFGDGYEQRVPNGINTVRRKWELTFANRPTATADAIEAFLVARGAVEAFDWIPPHGAAGKWVCRKWDAQPIGPLTRTVTTTFEEVFEA